MVPAFRLTVYRPRHDELITVLECTDRSSFKAFTAATSSSVPAPSPAAFDARSGCDASVTVRCSMALGREADCDLRAR